jgi:hypothetical protein
MALPAAGVENVSTRTREVGVADVPVAMMVYLAPPKRVTGFIVTGAIPLLLPPNENVAAPEEIAAQPEYASNAIPLTGKPVFDTKPSKPAPGIALTNRTVALPGAIPISLHAIIAKGTVRNTA